MSKAAVFFGTGYEEIEALTVVDILRRAGIETLMVSAMDQRHVEGAHNIMVEMEMLVREVDFEQVDVIVLPGGTQGTKNLEACEELMEQVDDFISKDKVVAAICAAPSILGHRGHLKGKKACAYPTMEDQLTGAQVLKQPAVIDGNIITGRGMGASIPFGLAILEKLQGREAAEKMAETIVYTL